MNVSPLFWVLLLPTVILIVLLIFGTVAKVRLRQQYPPIGRMVDIGGYRLHMHVEGEGTPTVVLDAGSGGLGLSWELVRPAIASVTRVVVYDRAGLGWSDPSPKPRRADIMAEELHTMLLNANIPGPYLLVGHSLGGPVSRQFAAKYPGEVSGLVMVDSAYEQQMKYFPERLVKMVNSMTGIFTVMKLLSKLGLFALFPKIVPIGDNGRLPGRTAEFVRAAISSSDSHLEALIAESQRVNAAETPPVKTLGDLPLIVISHGRLDANAIPPSLGPEIREEYEHAWQELQLQITTLSSQGKRIIAEKSGHNIIYDQPEIILDAILEMLNLTGSHRESYQKEMALAK